MCQIMKSFQIYSEDTRKREGYYLDNETYRQHKARLIRERIQQNEINARNNALKRVVSVPSAEWKSQLRAAECKANYQ